MKKNAFQRPSQLCLALAGALLLSGPALSATIATSPDPATIGLTGSTTVDIVYTGSAGINAFSGGISYDTQMFDATVAPATGVTCSVNDAFSATEGRVGVVAVSVGSDLPSGTLCTITFTTSGATEGDYPLTFVTPVFGGSGGGDTVDDGQITVQAAPPDADLVFDPASGSTITFPGGTQNDTVTASIDVTVTGTSGSGTVDNCVASGGAFSVASTLPISVAVGGSDSIDLECVLDDVAQSGTLTCDTTDVDGAGTASWSLSCPAGTPVPSPDFSSAPPAGSTIACNGAPGATVNRTIEITNTGNPGAGSDLTYTCTSDSASFVITSGGSDTLAVGDSATLAFSCTVPAAEGDPPATGTISCTSNGGDAAYPVSAGVVTTPPPVPSAAIIPANSLWSLLALFGVMAGIGAVVVGMRRH